MRLKAIAIPALTFALAVPVGLMTAKAYAALPAALTAGLFQERGWDEPPEEYRDAQRRGFHEGVEAARHDFERRNHKDADDHEAYRHPPVERDLRNDFREGFRRGYQAAKEHLKGEYREHDRDDHPY